MRFSGADFYPTPFFCWSLWNLLENTVRSGPASQHSAGGGLGPAFISCLHVHHLCKAFVQRTPGDSPSPRKSPCQASGPRCHTQSVPPLFTWPSLPATGASWPYILWMLLSQAFEFVLPSSWNAPPPPQHPQLFTCHLLRGLYSNVTFAVTPFLNTLLKMQPTPNQLPSSPPLYFLSIVCRHIQHTTVSIYLVYCLSLFRNGSSMKEAIFIMCVALSPVSRTEPGTWKYLVSTYLHKQSFCV